MMFQQLICQLFSNQSQLTSLHLDIAFIHEYIYERLGPSNPFSHRYPCQTLRNLYIRLNQTYFFEYLIQCVPSHSKAMCLF